MENRWNDNLDKFSKQVNEILYLLMHIIVIMCWYYEINNSNISGEGKMKSVNNGSQSAEISYT